METPTVAPGRGPTAEPDGASQAHPAGSARGLRLLTRRDQLALTLLIGLPLVLHLGLVWVPTAGSVLLSFTRWSGIGGLSEIQFVGLDNYRSLVTSYPTFWPALQHNLTWLAVFIGVATPMGIWLAVMLDEEIAGTRFYQSAIYLPFVLSLAVIGFIWQLQYAPEQGFINNLLGTDVSWLGDRRVNLWAVMLAASWRHVGYVMVIYLAGLKGIDPSIREAARVDGATERQTFFKVVLPVLRPVNVVILIITFIEALRAFDIVWVINKGRNGLELLTVLVTQNMLGASARVGFGSAIATVLLVISVGPILVYLRRAHQDTTVSS